AKAGVRTGDQLLLADGLGLKDDAALAELLHRKSPGEALPLVLSRAGKRLDLTPTLGMLSRPKVQGKVQAVLGVEVGKAKVGEGLTIEQVAVDSPAERAALR